MIRLAGIYRKKKTIWGSSCSKLRGATIDADKKIFFEVFAVAQKNCAIGVIDSSLLLNQLKMIIPENITFVLCLRAFAYLFSLGLVSSFVFVWLSSLCLLVWVCLFGVGFFIFFRIFLYCYFLLVGYFFFLKERSKRRKVQKSWNHKRKK